MNNNIEIIGITTVGTYPSWINHTIASFYNHVDKIIVINGGYDIFNPDKGALTPLEREHKLLHHIDINNKILEVTPTQSDIDKIFKTTCKIKEDEFGRSTNMTLATQLAHKSFITQNQNNHWVLKLDSDQILYQITRQQLENLIIQHPTKTGFRFAQYADYHHDFEHIGSSLPDEFTNDGALFHNSIPNQGYSGQGSPGRINVDQEPIYSIKTSHMRRISPPDIERYEYHFKRLWYHTYAPNSIKELDYNRKTGMQLTNDEIIKISHINTIEKLKEKGRKITELPYDERIPYKPPLVCQMSPLEYIKKGY